MHARAKAASAKADAGFLAIREDCLAIGAAIAIRLGRQVVPRDPRNVYLGAEAIINGRLAEASNAAVTLESLASSLK